MVRNSSLSAFVSRSKSKRTELPEQPDLFGVPQRLSVKLHTLDGQTYSLMAEVTVNTDGMLSLRQTSPLRNADVDRNDELAAEVRHLKQEIGNMKYAIRLKEAIMRNQN